MGIAIGRGLAAERLDIGSAGDGPWSLVTAPGLAGSVSAGPADRAAEEAGPLSAPDPALLKTIDWGTKVSDPLNLTVYFAPQGEKVDGVSSLGWNAYEKQQVMLAFEQFSNVCNVDVEITTNKASADFRIATARMNDGTLGWFNPPGESGAGSGVMIRNGYGWDEGGAGGLEQGGYGFITLIHEFGHGFGLAHPHDRGGTSTIMQGVSGPFGDYGAFDLNQGVFTTMSYNDGWVSHTGENPGAAWGYQATMMALDIAVLQQKYGANTDFHSGNDIYVLSGANAPGALYACLWDTGGKDSIVYGGNKSCLIDLRAATLDYSATGGGVVSYVNGIFGGYTIANGVAIEKASGGAGHDTIVGNGANNKLLGGGGNDTITGGAGRDVLTGGGGEDVFRFNVFEAKSNAIDIVRDFDEAQDVIDLSALDADSTAAGRQSFHFAPGSGFSGDAGEIFTVIESGGDVARIMLDVNGDAVSDMEILLQGYGGGSIEFDLVV
jgi:Ca2+-binding RTX toxin-like protein